MLSNVGIWGLIPPILAVYLAITTKDVFVSLISGIISGVAIVALALGQDFLTAFTGMINLLADKVSDSWNARILLFCIMLGGIVGMLNRSGSAHAFGSWAGKIIKRRSSVLFFSWLMGILLFLDDYFSALSVGSIVRPIADEKRISRAKVAYFVHTTAPTVCVLVPFSSWVVTIISQIRGSESFQTLGISEMDFFMRMIPYNLYVIVSLCLLLMVAISKRDMQPMFKSEERAILENRMMNEEVYGHCPANITHDNENSIARWFDMMLPLAVLILSCILAFPLSGGYNTTGSDGILISFVDSLRYADASKALTYGVSFTLFFTYIYFLARRIFNINYATSSLLEGMKSMIPALMVLALAWMIGHIISKPISEGGVGLPAYIDTILTKISMPLWLIPISMFVISSLVALATGTSWGTFGIMIPIAIPITITLATQAGWPADKLLNFVILSVAAVVSGAVFGDNGSPISDTTVLSAAGSSCPHLEHVATQFPYALIAALSSGFGILIASITMTPWPAIIVSLITVYLMYYCLSRPLPEIVGDGVS